MIATTTVLKIALNATSFSFVASLTIYLLSKRGNFTSDLVFIVVSEPDLRRPVYTVNMDPGSILEFLHHPVNVRAELAFNIDASFVLVLNKLHTPIAVPRLIRARKSIFDITAITCLVSC